jgi:hypothetical protein
LPTKIELESIVDDTRYNPSIDRSFTVSTNPTPWFWTATIVANSPQESAWAIDFGNGSEVAATLTTNSYRARCVR